MHNDFDAVGEEEVVVICFYRNLDLEENLLLRKDKLHNCKYILDCLLLGAQCPFQSLMKMPLPG